LNGPNYQSEDCHSGDHVKNDRIVAGVTEVLKTVPSRQRQRIADCEPHLLPPRACLNIRPLHR
jgi:hypothetical protein